MNLETVGTLKVVLLSKFRLFLSLSVSGIVLWLVKYKQEARTKLKKEDPVKFSEIKVEGKAKTKYDEHLE